MKTCLPSGVFMFTVIDRLLQFSMVKYRLSALGTSRNCPRVASPCGGSNLITSAPIHASSCEHVGPACTCVMSRMRTPFNASIFFPPEAFRLFLLRGRIEARDAAALGAGSLVDDCVDERRFARADRFFHRAAKLRRCLGVYADAAERFDQLLVTRVLHEHERCRVGAARRVLLVPAV